MPSWEGYSDRVSQASGMVSVQADCDLTSAIALLKERADETGYTLDQIARAVVDRQIRFD